MPNHYNDEQSKARMHSVRPNNTGMREISDLAQFNYLFHKQYGYNPSEGDLLAHGCGPGARMKDEWSFCYKDPESFMSNGGGNGNETFGDGTNFYNNMIAGRLGMDGYGQRKGGRIKPKRMAKGGVNAMNNGVSHNPDCGPGQVMGFNGMCQDLIPTRNIGGVGDQDTGYNPMDKTGWGPGEMWGPDDIFPYGLWNQGGYLQGPSHEAGGIPAVVGGQTPVELEGGEYIINKQTVDAVGKPFLDKLNSTQTTHHQGGYGAGNLPAPSKFKNGGKVVRRNKRTRPVPTRRKMAHGGMHCPSGQVLRNGSCQPSTSNMSRSGAMGYAAGGRTTVCPPGTHMMPNGTCMQGSTHSSRRRSGGGNGNQTQMYDMYGEFIYPYNQEYMDKRKGGKVLNRRRKNTKRAIPVRKRGGRIPSSAVRSRNVRKFQTGGQVSYYGSKTSTNMMATESVRKGSIPNNVAGANTKRTSKDSTGHHHRVFINASDKKGHTSIVDGHSHDVSNGKVRMACPQDIGCHSHDITG